MKNLSLLAFAIVVAAATVGCNGEPAPVTGDNPAAAGGVTAPAERASGKGSVHQTQNPLGTGRGGSGSGLIQGK